MGGNAIRCVAKYLYDSGIVPKTDMTVETASGVHALHLYTASGQVSLVTVDMGKVEFDPAKIPVRLSGEHAADRRIIDVPVTVGARPYRITCLSVGNPHCVVFADRIDTIDLQTVGPQFENADIFPERVNTEFARVVNRNMLRMRVYERGNGETNACGTGACAAVVAAVENGFCNRGEPITVKVRGGDLVAVYDGDRVSLTGDAVRVFSGCFEY